MPPKRTVKVHIVGQAPARGLERLPAFAASESGDRLAEYLGLPGIAAVHREFHVYNLVKRYPGVRPDHGDRFPERAAWKAAGRIIPKLHGARVVLLGVYVLEAFGINKRDLAPLEWAEFEYGSRRPISVHFARVPHPSGASAWWKIPENRERGIEFLRSIHGDKP